MDEATPQHHEVASQTPRLRIPRKPFDHEQFEKLCALQCTEKEIAGFFRVGIDTLQRDVEDKYGDTFAHVRPFFAEEGKVSLRRYQFEQAKKSPEMGKWLGKQMLGQHEPAQKIDLGGKVSQEITHTQRVYKFEDVEPAKELPPPSSAGNPNDGATIIISTNGNGASGDGH